jgi:site-specific DNA recombinase
MSRIAIVYAAKSTEDARGSIPDQLADGRALAERDGLEVVGEFRDENASAFKGNRGPDLERAMRECERLAGEGHNVSLVVQHSDRLARGDGKQARHLIEIVLWALKQDVALLSAQDPEILAGGDLALLLGAIGGMRNHQDSSRKSKSVRDGMKRRAAERGKLAGGPRPFGYEWTGPKFEKSLTIVPGEAQVVRRIFDDTRNGVSQMALARALTNEGIPTIHGGDWLQATVRRILTNPIYTGRIRHGGEVYPGEHEPIIDEATFEAARGIREAAAKRSGHGGGRWPSGHHLFVRGLLKCGKCRSTMMPRTDASRKGAGEWYICDGRHRRGVEFCDQPYVRREVIDDAMLAELANRFVDLEATRERLRAKRETDVRLAAEASAQAEAEALRADARLARVTRAFQDGIIEPDDYAAQRRDLLAERDAATAAVEQARERAVALESAPDPEVATLKGLSELRAALLGGFERSPNLNAVRRLLADLFESVTYIGGPGGKGATLVQSLNWNTLDPEVLAELKDAVAAGQQGGRLTRPLIRKAVLPLEIGTEAEGLTT